MTEYLMFQEVCFEDVYFYVCIYFAVNKDIKKVSCMKKEENELNCFQGLFRTQIKLFT